GTPTNLFVTSSGGCVQLIGSASVVSSNLTTGTGTGLQAKISTAIAGAQHKLFSTGTCQPASAVRYHG
ncbi:MAG TPA: hypothetical protein VIM89_11755, partial [Mucilaginibacter sp.]